MAYIESALGNTSESPVEFWLGMHPNTITES